MWPPQLGASSQVLGPISGKDEFCRYFRAAVSQAGESLHSCLYRMFVDGCEDPQQRPSATKIYDVLHLALKDSNSGKGRQDVAA